eukprot:ANDGO_06933.mRNA.1 hypothetical protein
MFVSGSVVAAFVPYEGKKKREWIVGVVKRSLGGNRYAIADQVPESGVGSSDAAAAVAASAANEYVVSEGFLLPFPPPSYNYKRGDKVLALWYEESDATWSTMFYKAIVLEPPTSLRPRVTRLQFESDQQARFVDIMKTVKPNFSSSPASSKADQIQAANQQHRLSAPSSRVSFR